MKTIDTGRSRSILCACDICCLQPSNNTEITVIGTVIGVIALFVVIILIVVISQESSWNPPEQEMAVEEVPPPPSMMISGHAPPPNTTMEVPNQKAPPHLDIGDF